MKFFNDEHTYKIFLPLYLSPTFLDIQIVMRDMS